MGKTTFPQTTTFPKQLFPKMKQIKLRHGAATSCGFVGPNYVRPVFLGPWQT
jgi:hypothetical protein